MSEYNDNNHYNNEDYAYQNINKRGKPKTLGWSVASLIIGIISVVCCCFGWSSLILGVIAIGLAILSRSQLGYFDGMAIAGLVLGIFGFVFGGFLVLLPYIIPEEVKQSFLEGFYEGLEQGQRN